MAVKAAMHVTDVSHLDQVNDSAASLSSLYATRLPNGLDVSNGPKSLPKFMVVGHRGHGMNVLQSTDKRMKAYKENSITSFNNAANHALDYIEFDVQVTRDNVPIIFHDNFIVSAENGKVVEKRVTDLTVDEFFSYGPQRTSGQVGKSLLRQINGNIVGWDVEVDDHSCTLEEAFQKVNPGLGFNIELKFDDYVVYEEEYLNHVLQVILKVVYENAQERPVLFSTFQPDVALLMKKLQHTYPVYFLTNGGNEIYDDVRRNSLEEAKKLAIGGGLDGIVSEVKGIFRNPSVVREIKESNLSLLTYGKLNNVPEAVHVQYLMGVEGVIVDLVQEITSAVKAYNSNKTVTEGEQEGLKVMDNTSKIELSFLLSLVSQLVQH
ncbi:PLC-like phosphodiesterase, TIM beta/alpha-barrel domain-containing protein [Artemisia annua]|uniref:glycerophosphodiester phosphodiesterase n=1 Tax=Artemisia annua TaxID=35608 RepID=A0A2U1KPW9_ARTAN|nr:PLC-like phosphodiesterase, TIM beta/alpha-barrel domain-containing protein [Artemisia annua]